MKKRSSRDEVTQPLTGNDATYAEATVGSLEPAYAVDADTGPGGPPELEDEATASDVMPDRVVRRDERGMDELPDDDEPTVTAQPSDSQPGA